VRWRWLLHDALPLIIMFSVLLLAGGAYAAYLDERKATLRGRERRRRRDGMGPLVTETSP